MTRAAALLRERFEHRAAAEVAVVLGSGLGGLADHATEAVVVPYAELPDFPATTVPGHAGRLVLGTLGGVRVLLLQGRAHVYEGATGAQLGAPVRTAAALGAHTVLLTNAAGSLRAEHGPGSLMLVTDHINLMGVDPLGGPQDATGPSPFVGMGGAYDPAVRAALRAAAERVRVAVSEGVYLAVRGPSFETGAEIRAFRTLGADAVGMSTVPEVIVARQAGLRVGAVSVLTNLAEGLGEKPPTHAQTLAEARGAAGDLHRLLLAALPGLRSENA